MMKNVHIRAQIPPYHCKILIDLRCTLNIFSALTFYNCWHIFIKTAKSKFEGLECASKKTFFFIIILFNY